jgi:hypothetical protein
VSYTALYVLAWLVTIASLAIAAIQLKDPTTLNIDPVISNWIGVAGAFLGALNGLLPRVTKPPEEERRGLD